MRITSIRTVVVPRRSIGRWLGIPVVMTARGTDVSLIPRYASSPLAPDQPMAAERAAGIINRQRGLEGRAGGKSVSMARASRCCVTGSISSSSGRSRPRGDRGAACPRRPTLISVGHLIERKGHDLIVEAMTFPARTFTLLIAGEGPERATLEALIAALRGWAAGCGCWGRVPIDELPDLYGAADALVLASSREALGQRAAGGNGLRNALRSPARSGQSQASSRRPEAGILMAERSAKGAADAVKALFARLPGGGATRAYAPAFSWDADEFPRSDRVIPGVGSWRARSSSQTNDQPCCPCVRIRINS